MKIVVLMSTYNGEKYLREQLDSIINQDIKDEAQLEILVRDDGSKDATHCILDEYAAEGKLTWYTGENLRPGKSFWHLVSSAPNADYYAFCDQDDVWFSDKLSRGIKVLEQENKNIPLLYCSDVTVTDGNLNPLEVNKNVCNTYVDYAHSLIYSTAPGCTFIFNDLSRREYMKYDMNKECELIHDWLAHKITLIKGKMILDKAPSMYYRQHGNNVIGAKKTGIKSFLDKINRFWNGESSFVRSNVAKSLLNVYSEDMSEEKLQITRMVANYKEDSKLRRKFKKEKSFKSGKKENFFRNILITFKKV